MIIGKARQVTFAGAMEQKMNELTAGQFSLVYNSFSFTFATMAAATLFLWFGRSQVGPAYKTALTISGLVYTRFFPARLARYIA